MKNAAADSVMTTYDPDTQVQDPSVLLRIVILMAAPRLSSIVTPGKIRVGDQARIVDL